MLIHYKAADGRAIELEVTEEVGNFYLSSVDEEKKSDRRNTRRHTYLSEFTHEDARYFDSGIDISGQFATSDTVINIMATLTERERHLIHAVHLEGRTYTEVGRIENKFPSTIMRETNKAVDKFKRLYA
jgi:RNA polymerase sigma-70 factor (ECF subfamily)